MSTSDEMDAVASAVAAMIPAPAVRAGWNIANLTMTMDAEGTSWTVDIFGPGSVGNEMRRYSTHSGLVRAAGGVRALQGVIGSIWAPDSDGLLDQVRQVAELLHWADIRDTAR